MGAKQTRQTAIRHIVRSERPSTQAELAAMLAAAGHVVTQTTVSRDLADMGLAKAPDGRYELAEDTYLKRMCRDLVTSVDRAANLVVAKTLAGTAQGVAAALDATSPEGILGCVAGDDTILIVALNEDCAAGVMKMLLRFSGKDA